jgi:hypothetical protein
LQKALGGKHKNAMTKSELKFCYSMVVVVFAGLVNSYVKPQGIYYFISLLCFALLLFPLWKMKRRRK